MELYDGRESHRRRKKVIRNRLRELFYETEKLSIKYKCILESKIYHKNFPRWFLAEIMVCIDMWKERMRLFELTNALSRKSEMIDEYFRIYTGSDYAYRKPSKCCNSRE